MLEQLKQILDYTFHITKDIAISVKGILIILLVLLITKTLLSLVKKILTRNMNSVDKAKVNTIFYYIKWFLYIIVFLTSLDAIGVNLNPLFAASAPLLIGVGLALQTVFQDIIAGVLILVDQTMRIGDIIELEGKIGRVEEVKLRTTRAVTMDNKVLVIPHHIYLVNSLYNWTQNNKATRESVEVSVAYGSDVKLVEKILLEATKVHTKISNNPPAVVRFTNFGDSGLHFKLIFTLQNSFDVLEPQSDIRFEIDRLFKANNIEIPYPQQEIHIKEQKITKEDA